MASLSPSVPPREGCIFFNVGRCGALQKLPSWRNQSKHLPGYPSYTVRRPACYVRAVLEKRFVYILKSINSPAEYYVGVTSDFAARLAAHNAGLSPHTAAHRPWRALVVIEFDDEEPALRFERYLKTGSGREFARRHFRQTSKRCPS